MEIKQLRDLTVLSIDENKYLAVACDSCGGIGNKKYDTVKSSPQITSYITGKVVLAELLSMGFKPLVLSNGLAVEMNDTGLQLIEGFNNVISKLKTCKVHLTGSTEENIPTFQTGMGVTCIGICEKHKLKYNKTINNDLCILVGTPLVGDEVLKNYDSVLDITDYENFYLCDFIKEILPIGSRGIEAELNELCNYNNLKFQYNKIISVDLKKSGGPSTCCLITVKADDLDKIKFITDKPIEIIGQFI